MRRALVRFLVGCNDHYGGSRVRFRWVKAPTSDELVQLTHTIAHRIARYLERQGLLVVDAGNSYLTQDGMKEEPVDQLLVHSCLTSLP